MRGLPVGELRESEIANLEYHFPQKARDQIMFVVTVEFLVSPETAGSFRDRVLRQARDSLSLEPECLLFEVSQKPEQPELFLLYERYTDEDAFEAHLASDHFLAFSADVEEIVVSRVITKWNCLSPSA